MKTKSSRRQTRGAARALRRGTRRLSGWNNTSDVDLGASGARLVLLPRRPPPPNTHIFLLFRVYDDENPPSHRTRTRQRVETYECRREGDRKERREEGEDYSKVRIVRLFLPSHQLFPEATKITRVILYVLSEVHGNRRRVKYHNDPKNYP